MYRKLTVPVRTIFRAVVALLSGRLPIERIDFLALFSLSDRCPLIIEWRLLFYHVRSVRGYERWTVVTADSEYESSYLLPCVLRVHFKYAMAADKDFFIYADRSKLHDFSNTEYRVEKLVALKNLKSAIKRKPGDLAQTNDACQYGCGVPLYVLRFRVCQRTEVARGTGDSY